MIETIRFDFHKSNLENLSFPENSILITSYNLHYWKEFTLKEIKDFIKIGIKGGIHIEPCSDFFVKIKDKDYGDLSLDYMIQNGYTLNIGKAFIEAKKEGLINIEICEELKGNGLLPYSVIKWWL